MTKTRLAITDRRCAIFVKVCARTFKVAPSTMYAPTRCESWACVARQVAMYLVHITFGETFTDIGQHFKRDRTTVAHAVRRIEDRRDNRYLDALLDRLEQKIKCAADRPRLVAA